MSTNTRIEIILEDSASKLQNSINDFFISAGNPQVNEINLNCNSLHQGNKIYVATINYLLGSVSSPAPSVKIFERDSIQELRNDLNAFIAPGNAPSGILRQNLILKQGNNSFVAMITYNVLGSGGSGGGGNTFEDAVLLLNPGGASTLAMNGGPAALITVVNLGGGQFKVTIPTVAKLKLGFFNSKDNTIHFSDGNSDSIVQNCVFFNGSILDDQINCIRVIGPGNNGFTGIISNILTNSFDIIFTIAGTGLQLNIQMHLIEEGGAAATGLIQKQVVNLSAAQIQSLGSTPVLGVAAPGAGKTIQLVAANVNYTKGTNDFTNQELILFTDTSTQIQAILHNLWQLGTSFFSIPVAPVSNASGQSNLVQNKALMIGANGDSVIGNGSAVVTLFYIIF